MDDTLDITMSSEVTEVDVGNGMVVEEEVEERSAVEQLADIMFVMSNFFPGLVLGVVYNRIRSLEDGSDDEKNDQHAAAGDDDDNDGDDEKDGDDDNNNSGCEKEDGGSEEDEFGTDIDNPDKSLSYHRDTNGDANAEKSAADPSSEDRDEEYSVPSLDMDNETLIKKKRRRLGSESGSTHSSLDEFADAMETIQRPEDAEAPQSTARREEEEAKVYQDQAEQIVSQAMDSALATMSRQREEEEEDDTQNRSSVDEVNDALDDAFAILDLAGIDIGHYVPGADVNKADNAQPVLVDEGVSQSVTEHEESAIPSSFHDNKADPRVPEDSANAPNNDKITTINMSVEFAVVESNDVPNAPVVKNALDDDVVDDTSDDTATSSDADTVKDAGGDVASREHDLDRDQDAVDLTHCESDVIPNVVADTLASEMVSDVVNESGDNRPQSPEKIVNVVAEQIAKEMLREMFDDVPQEDASKSSAEKSYPIPTIKIDTVDDEEDSEEEISAVDSQEDFRSPSHHDLDLQHDHTQDELPADKHVPNDVATNETFENNEYIPLRDENQNQRKIDVETQKGNGSEHVIVNSGAEIIIPVDVKHGQQSKLRDLLTDLTGQEIPSAETDLYRDQEAEFDPMSGIAGCMVALGTQQNNIDHADPPNEVGKDAVSEELIAPVSAKAVECSNVGAFCASPPLEDVHEPVPFADDAGRHGDEVLAVKLSAPSADVKGMLSALGGEGYVDDKEPEQDADCEDEGLRIEDFLVNMKVGRLCDPHDRGAQSYEGRDLCDENVTSESIPTKDHEVEDYFGDIRAQTAEDECDAPPVHLDLGTPSADIYDVDDEGDERDEEDDDEEVGITINSGVLDENTEVVEEAVEFIVPVSVSASESEPNLDISNVLSKVPDTPTKKFTPRKYFEDTVEATDVKEKNGRINLGNLFRSLDGDLSVDTDVGSSDVGEPSPRGKRKITDEMVQEAIQYLLQKPFLYYGMYGSQDSLYYGYSAVYDDALYSGGRTFALLNSPRGPERRAKKQSTVFALVAARSTENLDEPEYPSDIEDAIFHDRRDEDECGVDFNELFANLDHRSEASDHVSDTDDVPLQEVEEEGYLADESALVEASVPTFLREDYAAADVSHPEDAAPETMAAPILARENHASGDVTHPADYSAWDARQPDDAVPKRLGPDTISYSDDDSSSVSSSDTSGTYILDDIGIVEVDEPQEDEDSSYPRDTSYQQYIPPPGTSHDIREEEKDEEEEDEEDEIEERDEVREQPKASRMFFITSAMLAEMNQTKPPVSSSDDDYERRQWHSESSSSEDYLEEIPAGYGRSSRRDWKDNRAAEGYERTLEETPARDSPADEVLTAEDDDHDDDNYMRFRPISGVEESPAQSQRYPSDSFPRENTLKDPEQAHGTQVHSDYDSSAELLEIENQRQKRGDALPVEDAIFPMTINGSHTIPDSLGHLSDKTMPVTESSITVDLNFLEEVAPMRVKEFYESQLENGHGEAEKDLITANEPVITKDMHLAEELTPTHVQSLFSAPVEQSPEPVEDPNAFYSQSPRPVKDPNAFYEKSPESVDNTPTRNGPASHPQHDPIPNGHSEPGLVSMNDDSMLSHSDYRGYSGSSEEGDFDAYSYDDDSRSTTPGARMFALVGLPSKCPPPALQVTGSIEVYRTEEHMETQRSLYSYEISKGIAGPDGTMLKLQEQSFTFEQRTDIVKDSTYSLSYEVDMNGGAVGLASDKDECDGEVPATANHNEQIPDSSVSNDQLAQPVKATNEFVEPTHIKAEFAEPTPNTAEFAEPPPNRAEFTDPAMQAFTHSEEKHALYNHEHFELELPLGLEGENLTEEEALQRQIESLSELLSEKTLDLQRFKDEYPFLDRLLVNPKETLPGYDEGQIIGLLEVYRQLEEEVLELMNIYKETKTQLTELDKIERL